MASNHLFLKRLMNDMCLSFTAWVLSLWLRVSIIFSWSNKREGQTPTFWDNIRKVIFPATVAPDETHYHIYYFSCLNKKAPTDCENGFHYSISPHQTQAHFFSMFNVQSYTVWNDERLKSYILPLPQLVYRCYKGILKFSWISHLMCESLFPK